jgi:hypothetical protein
MSSSLQLSQADNASAAAAAATATGSSKRERDASSADEAEVARALKSLKESPEKSKGKAGSKKGGPEEQLPLRGAPYYFYTDHSLDTDEDPFTPVTQICDVIIISLVAFNCSLGAATAGSCVMQHPNINKETFGVKN